MPNRNDKNWIRLCAAVDGFSLRFDAWPTRVRMYPGCLTNLRDHLFTDTSYSQLLSKIELVPDEASMVAENDAGQSYDYGKEGFSHPRPETRAVDWFGVRPDRDE